MLEIFSIILTLILISKYIEDRTNISFVLIIVVLAYGANFVFDLSILENNFDAIVYLMLPIILIPDVLGLSTSELKENGSSIFFLAFIAVILSIILAVGFSYGIDFFHDMPLAYLILLFTPLMATDLVSVGAIFSKFNLPSKLKLYAEGESLFNDITAMILFFFVAIPLSHGDDILISSLMKVTVSTVLFSFLIGLFFGLLGYFSFKNARDNLEELITVYLMASLSFLLADSLHLSGILCVVIAVISFKYLFNKEGHYKKRNYAAALLHLSSKKSNSTLSLRAYTKESHSLGFFANAVIFTSIATVVDYEELWIYKSEILYIFALTTLIRYLIIVGFTHYNKHPYRWGNILTLAGMKGGLAIIMVISLGKDFEYKEMFVTITLGVVVLSIFINTFFLMLYLHFEKNNLVLDKADEHHLLLKNAKDIFQKESSSGAYNEIIFEDFVEKEIARASRYNQQFLLIGFRVDASIAKKIALQLLKREDYFGKIDTNTYCILLPHSSLDDIIEFTQKLQTLINHADLSIVQYITNDTKEILYEKLSHGFHHKNKIGIEV